MRLEICGTLSNVRNVVCKVSCMFAHWYVGPVVCVVSDMWRVSGMRGSVVCGGKWDAGSVVCCG